MTQPSAVPVSGVRRGRWFSRGVEAIGVRLVGRRVYVVAALTLKAAVRYRLIQVLIVLLLLAVVGLPAVIRDDGTARGFTQILLTYTLGSITVLLGFATLWIGCGTLARDVEECQVQVVATKPIARWQIWLGKWLGIMALNGILLAGAGLAVYGLMEWRASRLPAAVQEELRSKVLVARGAVREKVDQSLIAREAERRVEERLKDPTLAVKDRNFIRTQMLEQVKSQFQMVPPSTVRVWSLDLGPYRDALKDKPLSVRTRFYSPRGFAQGTFQGVWQVGPTEGHHYNPPTMSLAPETFHEFVVPAGYIENDGTLTVQFANLNEEPLLFPLEDGLEVLYPEGSYGASYARGLGIIFCWLALLAAIGLASASFLSFPVAAFVALSLLLVSFSTGTLRQVIEEGGVSPVNNNTGTVDNPNLVDRVAVPVFKGLLWTINLAQGFSPVDSLSSGRSISWGQLAQAALQIIGVMGGAFAAVGVTMFTRRELATAQGA